MSSPFQISFWEKNTYFDGLDLLIIGGGLVGLHSAISVKQRKPDWRILVVDRGGFLPYGASTRNAGFACFGSISELIDDEQLSGADAVMELVERRYRGLELMRRRLGDSGIGYEPFGGYELFTSYDSQISENCIEKMHEYNLVLERMLGIKEVFSLADQQIKSMGLASIQRMIFNRAEGQIDTGKMMQSLLSFARSKDIEVLNGVEVKGWSETGSGLCIETAQGFSFNASQVLLTTNAFAAELLPDLELSPGRAQVLVTSPVEGLKLRGSFHYDRGYYYFRNVGNRVLLGGGRNLDFSAEQTTTFGLTALVQDRLDSMLKEIILPGKPFQIEHRWSGIMGLGPEKKPIIRRLSPGISCAVRMGGMGVAIGALVGEEAAEVILGDNGCGK